MSKDKGAEVQILLGTYTEQGANHGRKTYKKSEAIPGHPGVNVFLYFWDARDGADFSGWWFGDQIGGSQVWARCPSQSTDVPAAGWLVPWDAPKADPGLLQVQKAAAGAVVAGGLKPAAGQGAVLAPPGKPETPEQAAERAANCKAKIESLEASLKELAGEAKEKMEAADIEALKEILPKLLEQQKTQQDEQKGLATELAIIRKGGLPCQASATEMLNLIKAMNGLNNTVKQQIAVVQAKIPKPKTPAEIEKEAKDTADLEENLPGVQEAVSAVKAGLDVTTNMATTVVDEEPEEGDALTASLEEIETAAKESHTKITEVRMKVNTQMQSARKYAPDVQKIALKEYTALQQTLTEAQKAINTYKNFKKEYQNQVTAKKAMAEFLSKFGEIETEVDKATGMSAVKDDGASAEDVKAAEDAIKPALQKVLTQLKAAQQKFAAAAVVKDQLKDLSERAAKAKEALEAAQKVLKPKLEKIGAAQVVKKCTEHVEKAEEAMNKCTEMEMPFLKGIEVGPGEESNKALAACDAAATQAQATVGQALGLLKQGIAATNQYVDKELAKETKEALTEFQETATSLQKKLADFRTSTAERKTAAIVAEVTELIEAAEAKATAYGEAAGPFGAEGLDSEPLEGLKEALEKSTAAEAELTAALTEARKCIQAKQSGPKQGNTAAELQKLNVKLNTAQQEMNKTKKTVAAAVTLIKSRDALSGVEEQMKEVEAEAAKVEKLAEGEAPSDEAVLELVGSSKKTEELIKALTQAVDKAMVSAVASTKPKFTELKEQAKATTTKLQATKVATKEPRERVLSKTYTEEASKKADEVETAMNKVNEAELPFLKGMENLPLAEAQESIKASKEAGEAAKASIAAARNFIGEKNKELATFAAEVAKSAKEELNEVMQRLTTSSTALAQFFKDVDGREKSARVQEAEQKILDLEAEVNSVVEAAKPLAEGEVEHLPEEEATAKCVKFLEMDKEAQAKLIAAKQFVVKTMQDVKMIPAHLETVKPLQAKLTSIGMELNKAKKSTSAYEQKITAKRVHDELGEMVKEMEAEKAKADVACAPLLDDGGEEFLVQACVRRFAEALQEHMAEKGATEDALLSKMATQSAFIGFIEKMPETFDKEELIFMEGRPAAMFKQIDADGDGKIGAEEFKAIFCPKYVCVKEIAVTDSYDMEKSTSTAKLKPGEAVEALSAPKTDDAGMTRIECKLPSGESTGWVTIKGNSGAMFLRASTPFDTFNADAEKAIDAAIKALAALAGKAKGKGAEFPKTAGPAVKSADAEVKEGSVDQLRGEVTKLMQQATASQAAVMSMRTRMKQAKAEMTRKEANERNAHVLAKEQRTIDEIMGPATESAKLVETNSKALGDVTAPFLALKEEELQAFATPGSTLKEAERLLAAVVEAAVEAKAVVKEQQSKATEVKGTLIGDARKKLGEYVAKASAAEATGVKLLGQVREQCKSIVKAMFGECSTKMRDSAESAEKLFEELAGPDGCIPEATLCSKLESLPGMSVKPEHAKLICHQIGAGGVGKYAFMKFLQRYYSATRATVITEEFDIESTKIVRKVETGEVIQLLEGPKEDAKAGLLRLKGRALRDNAEGWISVKGNKGGVFLEEAGKPSYVCIADIPLDKDIKGKDGEACTLKAGEVVELVEGPRKEKCVCAQRARGKALSDNAVGWVTVKNRQGDAMMEEGKYYTCTAATAMTDELDVKTGSLVKKLSVGEVIVALEEPQDDSGVSRVKAKILKEDKEGWVTLKSETGTTFFSTSAKHYTVLEEVALQKGMSSTGSETVRKLEQGEAFVIMEGPKDEAADTQMRGRGAALGSGAAGWFSIGVATKPWLPVYSCLKPVAIRDSVSAEEGKDIRDLAVNEVVDFLDGPKVDASGIVKIKGCASKDGSIGWVAIRGAQGEKLLESKGEKTVSPPKTLVVPNAAAGAALAAGVAPVAPGVVKPPIMVPRAPAAVVGGGIRPTIAARPLVQK